MKKLIALLLTICLLSGCAAKNNENAPNAPESPAPTEETQGNNQESLSGTSVSDWFPFIENTVYVYEGNGVVEAASYEAYYGYIEDNRAQRGLWTSTINATDIFEVSNGELRLAYGDPSNYFFDNVLSFGPNMQWVILKEPIEVGNKWALNDSAICEITDMNKTIQSDMGELSAMEVVTTYDNGMVEKNYYSKGIGLVQSVYNADIGEIVSTIKELKKDTGVQVPATFYCLDVTNNEVEKIEIPVTLKTNDDYLSFFENEMKEAQSEDIVPLLTKNTKIQSLTFDWDAQTATIDLSKEYLEEVNVGDGIQSTILQCITNTIGNFYGVAKVKITVDSKPFKSGSISFAPDEFLTVEKESV